LTNLFQEAASQLYASDNNIAEPALEAFIVTCSRLIPYHNMVLESLTEVVNDGAVERWDEVFSFTVRDTLWTIQRNSCVQRARSFGRAFSPRIAHCAQTLYRYADS
jgi:hypothetical protein